MVVYWMDRFCSSIQIQKQVLCTFIWKSKCKTTSIRCKVYVQSQSMSGCNHFPQQNTIWLWLRFFGIEPLHCWNNWIDLLLSLWNLRVLSPHLNKLKKQPATFDRFRHDCPHKHHTQKNNKLMKPIMSGHFIRNHYSEFMGILGLCRFPYFSLLPFGVTNQPPRRKVVCCVA